MTTSLKLRRAIFRPFAAATLVAACAGCTSITIAERDGTVRTCNAFGFPNIELSPGKEAMVAEITSLGYHSGPLGISVGFNHSQFALLGEDCRIVVWMRSPEDAKQLNQLLGERPGICAASINPEEKKP